MVIYIFKSKFWKSYKKIWLIIRAISQFNFRLRLELAVGSAYLEEDRLMTSDAAFLSRKVISTWNCPCQNWWIVGTVFFREDSRLHIFFPFSFFPPFPHAVGSRHAAKQRLERTKGPSYVPAERPRVAWFARGGFPIDLPAYNALLFYNCSSLQINRSSPFILIKTRRARESQASTWATRFQLGSVNVSFTMYSSPFL